MDFELQHLKLESYQRCYDAVLTREETVDSIIPDAFPDASRIICAEGTGYLLSKQAGEGSVRMSGTACVNILYKPEGDSYVRSIPLNVPFQCAADCNQFKESTLVHGEVLSVTAEARLTNPRKLFVKIETRIRLLAYNYAVKDVVCDLATHSDPSLQKKCGEYKDHAIGAVLEKPFTFSDVLHQSGTKPPMEELLWWRIVPGVVEAKYIGKKLITKGELILLGCYRSEQQVIPTKFELPFSQIIEVEGSFEEGEPSTLVALKNAVCVLQNGELEVSVEAVLQATLWFQRKVSLLGDVYSTEMLLDAERADCMLCTAAERVVRKESCRKFCESAIPAKQVIGCTAYLSPLATQRRENDLQCEGMVEVSVLYLTEDDSLCSVEYTVPISFHADVSKEKECTISGRPMGEATAVPVTGGFEVRAEIEFTVCVSSNQVVSNVMTIRRSNAAQSKEKRPSVILRMVDQGESLWEIAKSCSSTVEDICAANQLPGEMPEPGAVLLIPVHR